MADDNTNPQQIDAAELRGELRTLAEGQNAIRNELTEVAVVLKTHIGEQRHTNGQLRELLANIAERTRQLELWKERTAARLPETFLDGRKVTDDIDNLKTTITRWGAAISVLALVVTPMVYKLAGVIADVVFGGAQ